MKNEGSNQPPRGLVPSHQTIIAMPPKAAPGKQVILQQAPRLQLDQDIKAPNLIAFAPVPAPPPIERPKPKAFIPPTSQPRQAPAPLLSDAPSVEVSAKGLLPESPKELGNVMAGIAGVKPRRPVKAFTPPPAAAGRRNGEPGAGLDASAPAISGGSAPETFSAAIIGLAPSASLERIPQGSRPAQLSTGPIGGTPSSGGAGNGSGGPGGDGGIRIPDLSIRGGGNRPSGTIPGGPENLPKPAIEYRQTVLSLGHATMSVPLRPSARSIPASLEARFRGRNVYTLVIPVEKLPQYSGDWILWFAELEQKAGDALRAPMPARRIDAVAVGPADIVPVEGRVQMSAVIRKDGRIESVAVIRSSDARINRSAIEDLQRWEFSPAARVGAPLDVEIVVEIPFRLQVSRSAE